MPQCVVGSWVDGLDPEDTVAFDQAADTVSRIELYKAICVAAEKKPFGLTALKDHINTRCVCG